MEDGHALASPRGRITISNQAVAQIVGHTVAECYGVVGMGGRPRVTELLTRNGSTRGVQVASTPRGLEIRVDVVVEYGLNLAEVASTIRSRVAYEVQRLTGLDVTAVEVSISDVRAS